MCLLLLNKAEAPIITADQFKTAWGNNPHGGGLVYLNRANKMVVRKTQKSWEHFYEIYLDAKDEAPDSHFIVHFRWATHGAKNTENTHPFKVRHGLYFAHNGIISGYGSGQEKSDTRDFNDRILKQLPDNFHLNKDFIEMLSDHIGLGNKFVFLDDLNQYAVVNENQGQWLKGNWYSNRSHESQPTYSYSTRDKYLDGTFNSPVGKKKEKEETPLVKEAKAIGGKTIKHDGVSKEKMEQKYQEWKELLDRTIAAGEQTPNYLEFSAAWDKRWDEAHRQPRKEKQGVLWTPATETNL
jgi:predicted glutamine amidotransferase